MPWKVLDSLEGLDAIIEASSSQPQLIFKHSTRCGISSSAKTRLEQSLEALEAQFAVHYLDLIAFRPVSNAIAERLGVAHQSPQVIVVDQGRSVLNLTHYNIQTPEILNVTNQ